ncbi:hydrolase [Paenibacillus campi]|uniref:hydrolase n=1 Tax=Paenibacillus campi TaxID=3106031 RepID=UPI002AFFD2C1|nr:hydrolase [Paenibacillus sp. SGZ-1009]
MLLYASDLDQTLIYSERARGMELDPATMLPAETVDGRITSHISKVALERLQRVAAEIPFVPVTTRVLELYDRIHLFRQQVVPAYAITSNGAHILIDGKIDAQWHAFIMDDVRKLAAPAAEAIAVFHRIAQPEWVVRESYWEDTFFSVLVKREEMPYEQVMALAPELARIGWGLSIQGRKVYLVPFPVSKKRAIEHVKELCGATQVIASGDSLLDLGLLQAADEAIAPAHGELYRAYEAGTLGETKFGFTGRSGIMAADDILQFVADIMDREGSYANEHR